VAAIVELTDPEWTLVEDLFDPTGRPGVAARYPRRQMVEAILFLARTGIQWRHLPDRYPPWEAVWQQWRRWRENGVWARAMSRIARLIRSMKRAHVEPTMVMIDAQTVRGGRAGPTFHSADGRGGRTIGTKRSILIEILGRPRTERQRSASASDRARDATMRRMDPIIAAIISGLLGGGIAGAIIGGPVTFRQQRRAFGEPPT